MVGVSAKGKDRLRLAERSWLKFRDDNCKFMAMGVETGSVYPKIYSMCLTDMTTSRSRELDARLHCEEDDLSCSGQ